MPEDPKKVFKKLRADQAERERIRVQREIDRQHYRNQRGAPPEQENESEAAKWVRANFEWESHPGLWCPKYTSYSDYSGSCLDKANSMALLRDYPELFEKGTGGYGTIWTGIPEDKRTLIDEETFSSLEELFGSLEDYPVIDEDLMSNLEMEGKWEHWEEYGRDGIREALVEKFSGIRHGERDQEAPVDVNAQIAVFLQSNEFWDTLFSERNWDEHMEEEPGLNWAFHENRAARDVGADEIVNEEALNAFKRAHFIKNDLAEFVKILTERGLEVREDQALNIFLRLEPRFDVWEVKSRVYGHGKNADGTCPEVDPDDYISIGNSALTDMADAAAPGDIDATDRTRWANDPRQTKLPGFESKAQQLVSALLEAEDPKKFLKDRSSLTVEKIKNAREAIFKHYGVRDWEAISLAAASLRTGSRHEETVDQMGRARCAICGYVDGTTNEIPDPVFHPDYWQPIGSFTKSLDNQVRDFLGDAPIEEAESPKGVWGAIRSRNKDTKHVHVVGRRWFSRNFGNTYFAADIYVNGKLVHQIPYEYGHGDHYEDQSWEWLENNGYIPKRKRSANGGMTAPWRWAEQNGIRLTKEVYDVARRRDL